jgi:hypothetical protein
MVHDDKCRGSAVFLDFNINVFKQHRLQGEQDKAQRGSYLNDRIICNPLLLKHIDAYS